MERPSDAMRALYEDRAQQQYAEPVPLPDPRIDRKFARIQALVRGQLPCEAFLDAGCGDGRYLAGLAGELPPRRAGCDISERILETARQRVDADLRQANLEALPFADGEFDTVMSCLGVMFAPHHQASAAELIRVCRPGGTIGLLSWTPEGFIGQMFATMKPYAAASPPGAQPPLLWGREDHVRELLGSGATIVTAQRQAVRVSYPCPEDFRDSFKARYGPTIAAYQGLADDPERTAALDRDLVDLARSHDQGTTSTALDWEYLLLTARRNS